MILLNARTIQSLDVSNARAQKFRSRKANGYHIRHHYEYSVLSGQSRILTSLTSVRFYLVLLGYVRNVITLCIQTLRMRAYSTA